MVRRNKKNNDKLTISLQNAEGKILFTGLVYEIEFPEHLILSKSIEFYNDPEPCFIHRGAVVNRLAFELEETLIRLFHNTTQINADILEAPLNGYLSIYPETVFIQKEKVP